LFCIEYDTFINTGGWATLTHHRDCFFETRDYGGFDGSHPFSPVGRGPGGVGAGGGGRPGGEGRQPQNPTSPQQHGKSEQQGFNDCAKSAIRTFRRAEYRAIGKIAAGTAGTTLAALAGGEALAANTAAKGFSLPVGTRIVAYTARFKIGQIIGAGSSVVGVFTGAMALSGFSDSFRNNAQVDKALADCNAQFPQANHSTLGIFATTY
jgi:hypothetical protein